MGRMTRTRAAAARLAGALLLVSLVGCTADPPEDPEPTPGSEVALRVTTVSGAEGVDADTRADLEEAVGDALSSYVRAASWVNSPVRTLCEPSTTSPPDWPRKPPATSMC